MDRIKRLPLIGKIGLGLAVGTIGCCACLATLTAIFPSNRAATEPTDSQVVRPTQALATAPPATDTALPPPTAPPTTIPPTATAVPPTATHTPVPPPTATTGPTFTVVDFRSPVPVNGDAHVVIQTQAGATCFIFYRTPSGTASEADGLGPVTADANGVCTWTWQIGRGTNPGQGRVTISVGEYSQTLSIDIQ